MQNKSEKPSQWMSIGKAAKHLGVSRDTLRRWEKKGDIKPSRSPTNRRYYTQKQLDELMLLRKRKEKADGPPVRKLKKHLALGRKEVLILIGILSFVSIAILALYCSDLQQFDHKPPLSPLAP